MASRAAGRKNRRNGVMGVSPDEEIKRPEQKGKPVRAPSKPRGQTALSAQTVRAPGKELVRVAQGSKVVCRSVRAARSLPFGIAYLAGPPARKWQDGRMLPLVPKR